TRRQAAAFTSDRNVYEVPALPNMGNGPKRERRPSTPVARVESAGIDLVRPNFAHRGDIIARPQREWNGRVEERRVQVQPVAFRFAWYDIPYRDEVCQSPIPRPVFENEQSRTWVGGPGQGSSTAFGRPDQYASSFGAIGTL